MPVATGTTRDEKLGWEWLAIRWIGPLEPISQRDGWVLLRAANQGLVVPTVPPRMVVKTISEGPPQTPGSHHPGPVHSPTLLVLVGRRSSFFKGRAGLFSRQ